MGDIRNIRKHIRTTRTIYASRWCKGDGVTDDSANILSAQIAAAGVSGKRQVIFEPGVYVVSSRRVFQILSDLEIMAEGATFIVDAGVSTSGWDLSATDVYTYDNALFYALTPTIDNFKWYGGKFVIGPEELSPLQIGDSGTHTSGAPTNGGIVIEGLEQVGGNSILVLRSDAVRIRDVYQRQTHATALNVSACTDAVVPFHRAEDVGVNADRSQWNKVAALVANNVNDLVVASPRYAYTGGSALIARASSNALRRIVVRDPGITAAGEAGIGISVFTGASNNQALEQSGVFGGWIKGYLCGIDAGTGAGSHDGITIAVNKGGSGTAGTGHQLRVDGTQIDFCSPDETFSESTYDVSGSFNPKKAKATTIGTTYGVLVTGTDAYAPVQSPQVVGVHVRHAKQGAFGFSRCLAPTIALCTAEWCGYERDGSNLPLTSAHGIRVDMCAEAIVTKNVVRQHNPGCSGSGSANTFLVYARNSYATLIEGNQLRGNEGTAWNNAPIAHQDTAATFAGIDATAFGLTGRTCSTIVGRNEIYGTHFGATAATGTNVRMISGSAGHLVVRDDAYVARATNATSTAIEKGVTTVLLTHTSGTPTVTLPSAALAPGQRVVVRHTNAGGGTATLAAAAGAINGKTSFAASEFAQYLAEGANWEQVA